MALDNLLVCPAGPHEVIHLWRTVWWGIHTRPTFNHLHDFVSFHSLLTVEHIWIKGYTHSLNNKNEEKKINADKN